MNKTRMTIAMVLLVLIVGLVVAYQSIQTPSLSESHIRANVPDEKDFDRLMKKGLEEYFRNPEKVVTVDYELLRETPTQVAVGSPKFYVWVKVYENGAFLEEGAVRLGAIEKKEFAVIQYLSREDIERDPARMNYLFPKDAADKIREKMGK